MVFNQNVTSVKKSQLYRFLFQRNQNFHWTWSLLLPVNDHPLEMNFSRISPLHSQQYLYFSLFLLLLFEKNLFYFFLSCDLRTISSRAQLPDTKWLVQKTKKCPLKVKYNQTLQWNSLNSWFVPCCILLWISLFPQFLIIWPGFSVRLYPVPRWWTESLFWLPITCSDCSLIVSSSFGYNQYSWIFFPSWTQ